MGRITRIDLNVELMSEFWQAMDAFFQPPMLWNWGDQFHLPFQPAGEGSSRTVRSYDPNGKLAPAGHGEAHFVGEDALLAYKIRFENKSDATAPASIITVSDTLDEDVDLSTFELTEIALGGQTIVVPEGLNHYETTVDFVVDNEFVSRAEIRVQIDVVLDTATRELTLSMIGLDPQTGWLHEDIMAGILYPNDDTGRGDGHISYTVKPLAGLASGTEITNIASIVFGWNDPIETPLVLNTVDAVAPESTISPLPLETVTAAFTVEWPGQDDADGSGLSHFEVYLSDNGADPVLWLEDTEETSAIYIGQGGHTYQFYSIATDNVGHEEPIPGTPDAVTTMSATPSAGVLGRHLFYNASAWDWDLSADTDGDTYFDPGEDGPNDGLAIAPDKTALLPGGAATFANYTSYSRGING